MTSTSCTSLFRAAAGVAPAAGVLTLALAGILNLPAGFVTADEQEWHGPFAANVVSTIDVRLSNVPAGHDVSNGFYPGWCIEDNLSPNAPPNSQVLLYDTTAPETELPASYQGHHWDRVNYMLNHRAGHSVLDVQVALWVLAGTHVNGSFGVPASAQLLINDAITNGDGFVPGPNQIAGVLLYTDGIGPGGYQDVLIEVTVPGTGNMGLTPGYWKNHDEDWAATGLSLTDDFDTVFGVDYFQPNITLFQAVWRGGGKLNKVARHGTAALLNALHPGVDYPYTVAQVIAFVQAGDVEPLVVANELGGEI